MLTLNSPYTIILNRARKLIEDLENKIQAGAIDTRVTFLDEILIAVSKFARGLVEPSMTTPVMGKDELLVREYLTEPFGQAAEDVELAFDQTIFLRELARQVFNICQAERIGLNENIAEITALTDAFRLWVSDSDPAFAWVGDTFNDKVKVDPSSTVFVDPKTGTVTLNPISSVSLSDKIVSATIDRKRSEGGLPGNAMEIQEPGQEAFTGETPEPRPVLFGEVQPRKDSLAAVFDGNPDTWFEWERNYIDPAQAVIKAGQAYVFDPAGKTTYKTKKKKIFGITYGKKKAGLQIPQLDNWTTFIRWPGDTKTDTGTAHKGYPFAFFKDEDRRDLFLGLEIVLDQPRAVSWITLTPLIKGNTYPEVEQILISADGNIWKTILSTPTVLHPRMNRGIDFSQYGNSSSNFEGVGVWPVPGNLIKYVKIFVRQPNVYAPDLGLAHKFYMEQKKRRRTKGPVRVTGSFTSTAQESAEVDFSKTEGETQIEPLIGYDIFEGQRQVIAIRDLLLEARTYNETGQFLSRPLPLEREVKSVALLSTEKVPDDWPDTRPDGSNWIDYEISPDGQNWQRIISQVTELQDSIVRFDKPTRTVYLRANFSRPADRPTESPLLLAYALKLLV